MTDGSDSKPPSIPAWQTTISHNTTDTSSDTSKDAAQAVPAQDRRAVLDQARIFLDDASVRDSPREKKVAFLAKKGLQNDEIQRLLDTSSSETASSSASSSESSSPASHVSAATTPPSSSSQTQPASQPNREVPPIITYPEFLLRPSKPPPLITLDRLTYSLYTLAGISAFTYGASKYLVQPMLQSLSSSRHELASTALHNLEKLNEKLEGSVSHIPAISQSAIPKQRFFHDNDNNDESASDIETADSDLTELFHRDMATQTSPRLLLHSPSLSNTSSTTSSSAHEKQNENAETATATTTQHTRLLTLKDSLTSLLATESPSEPTTSTSTSSSTTNLLSTLSSTQSYLDRLQFSLNAYNDYHHLFSAGGSTLPATTGNNRRDEGKKGPSDDEAVRFRQEILSVKGALLGVRSFPLGSRVTAATGAGGVGVR
ncbi:hypothetical protein EPUS_01552 [Endocarpon pusillum Z07020]|uniref:Peroxisomal membrane protein PEX14 n=1 Tax=Endocarpon pusillum (strain Z07020 / HMAS-L-300199) TaxID=1263415 RepID=U1GDQ0_ENDPU|nr:uncharacterized protein EPUS_01552 [Endocarpon pusillum Z07020]ERF75722.1 hypothetical protein EPUS_01552 [Endocarpon pusillum Z07020]